MAYALIQSLIAQDEVVLSSFDYTSINKALRCLSVFTAAPLACEPEQLNPPAASEPSAIYSRARLGQVLMLTRAEIEELLDEALSEGRS